MWAIFAALFSVDKAAMKANHRLPQVLSLAVDFRE
jgi:hypothetical protein